MIRIFHSQTVFRHMLLPTLMLTTAMFAPWWGTPIIAIAVCLVLRLEARWIAIYGFFAWVAASFIRDTIASQGPSRVLGRILPLEMLGVGAENQLGRLIVYTVAGIVGCLLAASAAGLASALRATVSSLGVGTSRG